MDTRLVYPNLRNAPTSPRYNWCPGGRRILSLRTGISVGWADVYTSGLPDQYIDVTGLPHGSYTLEVVANPDGILQEKSRTNNIASVEVDL
jgi:hypothetical protein